MEEVIDPLRRLLLQLLSSSEFSRHVHSDIIVRQFLHDI